LPIAVCTNAIGYLAKLPNLNRIKLADQYPLLDRIEQKGKVYAMFVKETSEIVDSVADMTGLESLDIEFDSIVNSPYCRI
jgi:hypothetical protein